MFLKDIQCQRKIVIEKLQVDTQVLLARSRPAYIGSILAEPPTTNTVILVAKTITIYARHLV